jgi:phosphoribosylanthranilate isomerase
MPVKVKICGINDLAGLDVAQKAGASLLGFVFYPKSPRHLTQELAAQLAGKCDSNIERVALMVDPNDNEIEEVLGAISPHRIQLHGHETPERVAEIRLKYHRPIIKAFGIANADDLAATKAYEDACDWFLFDAKPTDRELPGGNGKVFDWGLISAYDGRLPWMLSGGLTDQNVAEAIEQTGANMVDVSSGVEIEAGKKDPQRIEDFIEAAMMTNKQAK